MKGNKVKKILLIVFCLSASSGYSQSLIKERVFSKILNDTLLFNVWLPYNYEKGKEEYPVIFLHNYGALDNYGMNIAAELNKSRYKFPKSVVVELMGSTNTKYATDLIDFSYYEKRLKDKGENYLNILKAEVFPLVKEKYFTSDFRAYMGHSYLATYANLLFTNYPGTFDAYILFAPESLNDIQENFQIDTTHYDYKNKFYYVSTGSKDASRRITFNKTISKKIGLLSNVFFQSQIDDSADHNSIVDEGVANSLKFVFHQYFTLSNLDSANLVQSYQKEVSRVKLLYKIENFRPENYYYNLYSLGSQFKDKDFIEYIVSAEKPILDDPLHVFNIGYIYNDTFNDQIMAEKYYRKSIEVSISNNRPRYAFNAYSWLSKIYSDKKNYKKSFKILQEGYDVTGNYVLLYQAAKLAELDNSLLPASKAYMKDMIKNFKGSDLELLFAIKIESLKAHLEKLERMKNTAE